MHEPAKKLLDCSLQLTAPYVPYTVPTMPMTAVLIPPSPQPETIAATAIATETSMDPCTEHFIVQKVQNGTEEITPKDLLKLDAAIAARSSTSTSTSVNIPLVNRAYIKSCDSNPRVLVRYIGMVQDMLDPEYYVTKVNGIHTKYREYYCLNDGDSQQLADEITMNHLLEERQPLLLVPVPHSTEVLRNCIRKLDPTSTSEENSDGDGDAIEEKLEMNGTSDGSRKRRLENATDDEALRERNDVHVKQRNLKASASSTPMDNRFTWWPEGCMNSDPEHCPVLAKMYYPENEEAATSETQSNSQPQPRLQLNDIVEVYGILSLDPLGASFEDQNSNGKGSNLDFEAQQESFFHDFVDRMVVPPPSLLPRLHVLKYNKLDLDEMVVEAEAQEQEQEQVKAPVNCSAANANDCERQLTIDTFATCIFDGDKIASETLLMTCMSLAERDYRCQNANASPKAIQMPDGATLGCGSINFVLSTREACMLLQERLRVVLGEIAPVVANINLSLAALNGGDIDAGTGTRSTSHDTIIAPGKNAANRLEPSALQLPKASCLVINQAALTEGTINQSGQMALASLSKMTRTHTIPYQFDGLMEIDFEADHRIIVICAMLHDDEIGLFFQWR